MSIRRSVSLFLGLILALGVLASTAALAVGGMTDLWTRQFGTPNYDGVYGVALYGSGVYVVGDTEGAYPGQSAAGDHDGVVRRYDTAGNVVWTHQFGTATHEGMAAIAVDASGVYIAGDTWGALPGHSSAGSVDAVIRKYDFSGNVLWTHQFGTSAADPGRALAVDGSGVYLAGETWGALPGQTAAGSGDGYVRKYDSAGNVLWTRQFGTNGWEEIFGVAVDGSGIYVSGWTHGTFPGEASAGGRDAFVRKYDLAGNVLWTRQFGTGGYDTAFAVAADGWGVYVTGGTGGTFSGEASSGGDDVFVRKYDPAGNLVWTRQFGTNGSDRGQTVATDGSVVYVVGWSGGALPDQTWSGDRDAFVRAYDLAGNELETVQFGTSGSDRAAGVAVDGSAVYVVGLVEGALPGQTWLGNQDAFLRKHGVLVPNQGPTADANGPYLVAKGSSITLSGTGIDPDGDLLTYGWDLDSDGIYETPGKAPLHYATGDAAVETVWLQVCDDHGACGIAFTYLVVYDPSAGFATGGGWIVPGGSSSDAGDVLPGLDGASKATFGFVVKYHNGSSTVPGGNLEFHYNVGGFHLRASAMEWLVVTNNNWAKFQGLAEINGLDGLFPFRVDARDGNDTQQDRFVIKIWAPGANPDTDEPIYKASGDLNGGRIKIHR